MMKTNKTPKYFWFYYHLGLVPFSALAAMYMKYDQLGNAFDPTVLVPFVSIYMISAGIGYLTIFMTKKGAKYSHHELSKKIIPALILFYIGSYIITMVSISLGVLGWYLYLGQDLSGLINHLIKYELSFGGTRLFAWLMFFTIAFFYILWQKSTKKEQKLREENLKHKYQNLKARVNPHFLFNSLNTLSEIIYEDITKADNYIQKLSETYRYILENEEVDLIDLSREIDFVQQYFSLQKERDNDKIILDIDIHKTKGVKILPVSLQMLVENALKHNSYSKEKPLTIHIEEKKGHLVVSNSIQRKSTFENSLRSGLGNLKERTMLIMNKEVNVYEKNKQFIVELPIIQA